MGKRRGDWRRRESGEGGNRREGNRGRIKTKH